MKTYHQEDLSGQNSIGDLAVKENEARSRLILLEQLAGEIMDSPQSVQDHTTEAGPGVVKAVVQLNKEFHLTDSSTTSTYGNIPGIRENPPEASGTLKKVGCLPILPPILDGTLRKAVFMHPGLSNNIEGTYDRLEILGDAYIELIATKLVWSRFQEISSGRISQIRELLVKNETLSEYATKYGLDSRASVPQGYLDQPKRWTKTKGDIFEAYVAGVILSHPIDGFRMAEEWLTQLWLPKLQDLGVQKSGLQAKEALAKRIMGKGVKLNYIDEQPPVSLRGGMQTFFIGVYLTGWGWDKKHLGSGQGRNKAIAGDEAAKQALLNEPLIDRVASIKIEAGSRAEPSLAKK